MVSLISPGPIVRIAPDELHIRDADMWDTIYTKAGRVDRYHWMANRFSNETSVLTTASDSLHRVRRGALNPFFSKQRIVGLQDIIRQKLDVLVKKVEGYKDTNAPMTMNRAFMAFSEDVIMQYSFGHDYAALQKDESLPVMHDPLASITHAGNAALQFPLIPKVMNAMPQAWIEKLDPLYGQIFQLQRVRLLYNIQS